MAISEEERKESISDTEKVTSNLWFWEQRIKFLLFKEIWKDRWMNHFYCKKGLHRLIKGETTVTNSRGLKLHTSFLRCVHCNAHFFSNKKDKESYLRIREREKKDWDRIMSYLLLKDDLKKETKKRGKPVLKEFDAWPKKRKTKR